MRYDVQITGTRSRVQTLIQCEYLDPWNTKKIGKISFPIIFIQLSSFFTFNFSLDSFINIYNFHFSYYSVRNVVRVYCVVC